MEITLRPDTTDKVFFLKNDFLKILHHQKRGIPWAPQKRLPGFFLWEECLSGPRRMHYDE
jgi:hypothetical protein